MATKTRAKNRPTIRMSPLLEEIKEKRLAVEKDNGELSKQVALAFDGLTAKQRLFVQEYAETSNGVQAALKAYATEDYSVAGVMAWENLNKPKIKQALGEYMDVMAGKNFVLSKFHRLASSAKSQDTQLRATTELAKINGLYNDNSTVKDVNIININLPSLSQTPDNVIDVGIVQ